jgi:hypothetical protein
VTARLFEGSLVRFEERMLSLWGARDEDLAGTQRLLGDPAITFRVPTVAVAWGGRPP